MPNSQPKSCGVLIVRGRPIDSFLLMKHPDRWDLPKGHVDPGETELECALREMEEETGIPRAAVTLIPDFRYEAEYHVSGQRYGGKSGDQLLKKLVLFLGRLDEDCPIAVTEHGDFRWFDWDPPHKIQKRTIDPVLALVEKFLRENPGC
ncbi:MAG: NUDIX domain-containing protein [Planctomycetaceae bacterium]|nr:NUDIX domain-containing protein [Planctomycetaceae bacterium]